MVVAYIDLGWKIDFAVICGKFIVEVMGKFTSEDFMESNGEKILWKKPKINV